MMRVAIPYALQFERQNLAHTNLFVRQKSMLRNSTQCIDLLIKFFS